MLDLRLHIPILMLASTKNSVDFGEVTFLHTDFDIGCSSIIYLFVCKIKAMCRTHRQNTIHTRFSENYVCFSLFTVRNHCNIYIIHFYSD